ncbi:DUF362 domain-containing protein [bacterium]|nr:DUF362 domain-containing protein [bacterium]
MTDILNRRSFLKIAGTTGAGSLVAGNVFGAAKAAPPRSEIAEGPLIREVMPLLDAGASNNVRPVIRSEIRENPKAVFIIETTVKTEKDGKGSFDLAGPQLEEAGYSIARSLFERGTEKGGKTAINPNWTYINPHLRYPTIGITVAPQFVAGFAEGLRGLGNTNIVVTERSAGANFLRESGHLGILDEHKILFIDGAYKQFDYYDKDELNWFDLDDGVVWKRVPVFRPHFDRDTFNINMPKFKNHNLGLTTLSIKNRQGLIPTGYGHYCDQWHQMYTIRPEMRRDINPDYWENVEKSFLKHAEMGYKAWDIEKSYGAYQSKGGWKAFRKVREDRKKADEFMKGVTNLMWDEQWGQRTIDTVGVLRPDINIVEGVIGRDGDAFANGTDYLTNYVVAGLDLVATDTVTSYLMGQDPRELYYLRMARERGHGPIDPAEITVYRIKGNTIEKVDDIRTLKRYRLGFYLHSRKDDGLVVF